MAATDYDKVASLYDAFIVADYDVPFFTEAAKAAGGPVLELTSGTGRLSIPLAESGVELTCVDCARGMLAVLGKKLEARGLRAEIVCCDVCALELPGQQFALAILPFQAFMEFVGAERQRAALAAVFRALRPGGRFLCTMHNPVVRRVQVDGMLHEVGRVPFEGGTLVVTGVETGGTPVVSRTQYFELFRPDGASAWQLALPMEFEIVERDAFERMATDAGFRVRDLYGDYAGAPLVPATSPVMIWDLERPKPHRRSRRG